VPKSIELTDRERQLLRGILADQTYSQIAHDLGLSHETIKSYAARVRSKLGIYSKVGLAVWASKHKQKLKD